MANIFTGFLNGVVNGATHPKGQMGDFQHAARMFTDDTFRLAPKLKFQFHVAFSINPSALKNIGLTLRHKNEINMLVKSVSLPNFNIATETLHQYNRKKVIQTKIDYQPINIKFHDDNMGVVNQLWQNYYGYYFADSTTSKTPGAYNRTAMLNASYLRGTYGLDNNSSVPFFNKITIYQMARQEYVSYTLVNPLITNWNHEGMDYASSATHENQMTLAYEAVNYGAGRVQRGDPEGFALEHYDLSPSPLSVAGGGTATLFGNGGVIAGAADVLGSIFSGQAFESPANFISTAIKTVNTYQNSKKLTNAGVTQEGKNIIVKTLNSVATTGVSGVNGVVFPQSSVNVNTSTAATPINLNGNGP
jgi:hypothetical protein